MYLKVYAQSIVYFLKPSNCMDGLVALAGVSTPDPIPNSEVKAPSADGTSS